jgi:hypothetical protein
MLADGEQVAPVARDEGIHSRPNCAGEDQVIIAVARHGLGRGRRRRSQINRELEEKLLDSSPMLRLEAHLSSQDLPQLHHHRLEQDKLQASVDRLLEEPARRPRRDEGGDQDVGVAGDSQG